MAGATWGEERWFIRSNGPDTTPETLEIEHDGGEEKLLIGGRAAGKGTVERLHADGYLDSAPRSPEAPAGFLNLDVGAHSEVVDLAISNTGSILALLSSDTGSWLVRVTANLTLDSSFNSPSGGPLSIPFPAKRLVVDGADRILVVGASGADVRMARYASGGAPDLAFNQGPGASTAVQGPSGSSNPQAVAADVILPTSTSILVGGSVRYSTDYGPSEATLLLRFDTAGVLDSGFGNGGRVVRFVEGPTSPTGGVVVDPSGRIVVAGSHGYGGTVQRFLADGTPDPAFGGYPSSPPGWVPQDTWPFRNIAVEIGSDGQIVIAQIAEDVDTSHYGFFTLAWVQSEPVVHGAYVLHGFGDAEPRRVGGELEMPWLLGLPHFQVNIARDIRFRPGYRMGYVLDGNGPLHPFFGGIVGYSPYVDPPAKGPYFGFDIARRFQYLDADGGYILDGYGGVHGFAVGSAAMPPTVSGSPYFPGFDIARDVALTPDRKGGYVLDGWGGIHAFRLGNNPMPPAVSSAPYFPGFDIAKKIALLPDGSGGYELDGFGGVHGFAVGGHALPPKISGGPYFGFDIARDLQLTNGGGYVLDGWGAVHTFTIGGGPRPSGIDYFRPLGSEPPPDIFKALALKSETSP